jgi:hypothetical protein
MQRRCIGGPGGAPLGRAAPLLLHHLSRPINTPNSLGSNPRMSLGQVRSEVYSLLTVRQLIGSHLGNTIIIFTPFVTTLVVVVVFFSFLLFGSLD